MARWNLYKWVLLSHLMMAVNAEGNCSDGAVRLVDGQSQFEGRVEVCLSGTWGTVCDSGVWSTQDAEVVCSQLTATGGGVPVDANYFGTATGPISLMNVQCSAGDDKITECLKYSGGGCDHDDDVGLFCPGPDPTDSCTPGEVRMIDNTSAFEICYREVWGPVCADVDWNDIGATAICKGLNLVDQPVGFAVVEANSTPETRGSAIFQTKSCNPELWHIILFSCYGLPVDPQCQNYAGVLCLDSDHCDEGSVQLTNKSTRPDEGVVEVCHRGVWGALCGDGWSSNEATVLCRQLGYIHGYTGYNADSCVKFEVVNISSCIGTEPNLFSCFHGELQAQICYSGTHAQVFCTNTTSNVLTSSAVPSTAYSGYVTTTLECNLNLPVTSTPEVFSHGPVSTVVTSAPKASSDDVIVTGVVAAVSATLGISVGIGITVPILLFVFKRRARQANPLGNSGNNNCLHHGHADAVREGYVNAVTSNRPQDTYGNEQEKIVTEINDSYSIVRGDMGQLRQPHHSHVSEHGVSGEVDLTASYHDYECVPDSEPSFTVGVTVQMNPAYKTLMPYASNLSEYMGTLVVVYKSTVFWHHGS